MTKLSSSPHLKLKFSNPMNVPSELKKLVSEGSMDPVFAHELEPIIADCFKGIITGRKLSNASVLASEKYADEDGSIKIQVEKKHFQLVKMTKKNENGTTSYRWKVFRLHGEGYSIEVSQS